MKALAAALAALVVVLMWTDRLGGWVAAWHSLQVRPAVGDEAFAQSLQHRIAALDADPLSRKRRVSFGDTLERAFPRLGADGIAALAPRSTVGRATVAAVLERHGATAKAASVRAAVGDTRPEEIEVLSAAELRAIGIDAAAADRCREALPVLDEALRRGLGDWSLALKRAACLTDAGDASRALEALLPMYEHNPESPWGRLFLAKTEARLGHLETAESLLKTLVWTNPDFYEMWRFAGELLAAMNRPADAARSYRRALFLRPENTWIKQEIWKQERAARAAAAGPTP